MFMNKQKLIQGDCIEEMKKLEENSIDLTVTSPPYDNLRTYNGNNAPQRRKVTSINI